MTTYAPPLPSRRLLPSAPVVVPPSYLGYRTPFCLTNPTLATRRSDDFSGRDSNLPRLVSTSRYALSFLRTDDNGPRAEEEISLAFNPLRCALGQRNTFRATLQPCVSVVRRRRATDTTVRRTERTRFRNYESEFLILRRQLGWFTLRSKFYSVGVLSISVKHRSYDNAESWISVAVSFSEASNGENDYESTKIREFDRIGCRTSQFVTKKDTRAKRVQ